MSLLEGSIGNFDAIRRILQINASRKQKGFSWTHNSVMALKLMQNEVNATLNLGGTSRLVQVVTHHKYCLLTDLLYF